MKKRTTEEFINQVKLLSPDIEVLGQYTGYKKPVKVRCLVCGKEWETSAGNLLMGRDCKECRIKIFTKSRTKTNKNMHKQPERLEITYPKS